MILASVEGNLGRDPAYRYGPHYKLCTFSVACDSGDENRKNTTWVTCNIWDGVAEQVAQQLRKGDRVKAHGTLIMKEYRERRYLELTVISYEIVYSRWNGTTLDPQEDPGPAGADHTDDDIPF